MGKKALKKVTKAAIAPMTIGMDQGLKLAKPITDAAGSVAGDVLGMATGVISDASASAIPSAPIEVPPTVTPQPDAAIQEAEAIEGQANLSVTRRNRRRRQTQTLLTDGLGSPSQASVSQKTLLGA